MDLHSQWEAFSSQPSGNLDKCLMFHQGTPRLARLGYEISLDEVDLFPLSCSKETLEFQRPWEGSNHIYVSQGLCFMNLVGEKGQKHRTRLDISGSQLIVSWVPATRLVIMSFTGHLWRRNRGKSFGAESNVVKGPWESHRTRWNKSNYLFLCSISFLEFLLLRTSTWR